MPVGPCARVAGDALRQMRPSRVCQLTDGCRAFLGLPITYLLVEKTCGCRPRDGGSHSSILELDVRSKSVESPQNTDVDVTLYKTQSQERSDNFSPISFADNEIARHGHGPVTRRVRMRFLPAWRGYAPGFGTGPPRRDPVCHLAHKQI